MAASNRATITNPASTSPTCSEREKLQSGTEPDPPEPGLVRGAAGRLRGKSSSFDLMYCRSLMLMMHLLNL